MSHNCTYRAKRHTLGAGNSCHSFISANNVGVVSINLYVNYIIVSIGKYMNNLSISLFVFRV